MLESTTGPVVREVTLRNPFTTKKFDILGLKLPLTPQNERILLSLAELTKRDDELEA